jgi:hypothetical protein
MDVPGGGMDVEVDEEGRHAGMCDGDAGLLLDLTECALGGGLTGIDVATRLQPHAEPLVPVEENPARAEHDRRRGAVHAIPVTVERIDEPVELDEKPVT